MISQSTIQKINDEARVEEVVGEFVTLKRRGANMLGLCPFHNEKTPSFNVNPTRNIYKCFGCGKAGGPIQFLMDYQQLSYPDALRYLAKKYNIEIEETARTDDEQREQTEKQNQVESIYIANQFAQKFFSDFMLHHDEGRIGLAYFKERGFHQHTIEKFQLGFAPDGGDSLTKKALKEGFQLEVLKKAGLTSPKENSTYDFFRNRVMFPIHNMTGKVVGFGGRIMVKDEKAPKYVNTPESDVYQKSKILYGAFFARNEIRKLNECILVEGYTDVISLHQAGVENAVASSGTALTADQIRLIKRITPNITIVYDGDAAGIKAALRGTDLILEEGMNVRIVVLPADEDPDSFVRKAGQEGFNGYLREHKRDLILFKTSLFAQEAKSDPIKKAELIRDIIQSIARIPDGIQRSVYVKESSQLFDMNEQVLITEVNKLRRKKSTEEDKESEKRAAQSERHQDEKSDLPGSLHKEQLHAGATTLPVLERDLIRVLIEFGNWKISDEDHAMTVTHYVLDELEGIEIETPQYKEVFDLIRRDFGDGAQVHDEKFFTAHDEASIRNVAIELLAEPYQLSQNWWNKYKIVVPEKKHLFTKDIFSTIYRLRQYKNFVELKKVEKLIHEAKDENELMRLMKLHKLLIEQKKEYAKTVGNVIYRPVT